MSEVIQFGTFDIYFGSDRTCRIAPPFPANRRRPRPQATASSITGVGAGATAAVPNTFTLSPSFLAAIGQGYIIPAPFDFRIDCERRADGDLKFPQQ